MRPSARALAVLALVLTCSATSYAAGAVITSSAQIKNGVVTGSDLKDGSVTATDLRSERWRVVGAKGQPGFQGAWVPYSGHRRPAFHKDALGRVELRGVAGFGSNTPDSQPIFTLPKAYRPRACVFLQVVSTDGNGVVSPGAVVVCPSGLVAPLPDVDERFLSLDGLAFDLR